MNADGNGSLRYPISSLSTCLPELSFNSTPAGFTPSNLVGVLLTTLLAMHSAKGVSHDQGTIRSHPCSSVATLFYSPRRFRLTG